MIEVAAFVMQMDEQPPEYAMAGQAVIESMEAESMGVNLARDVKCRPAITPAPATPPAARVRRGCPSARRECKCQNHEKGCNGKKLAFGVWSRGVVASAIRSRRVLL